MIEKIDISEDIVTVMKNVNKILTPEERINNIAYDYNVIALKAVIDLLIDKINEIVDVTNGK